MALGRLENPRCGLDGIPIEDFRAYPVEFLYRHALELYMKAVLLVGSPMLAIKGQPEINPQQLRTTHNFDVLTQELERIFEAYFTTKHTGPNPGMGLGLAVCQKIVMDHDGKMSVRSRPGETVFTIRLPRRKKEA